MDRLAIARALREIDVLLVELSQVPRLSVPRIAALHQALGVISVEGLRAALEAGHVRGVPGFGAKTEAKILAAEGARNPRRRDAPPSRDGGR
jgi:DNA polymerase (family 10)